MTAPKPKVLLIEDEKTIRRFVRAAVEEEGCTVAEAETMAGGLIEAGVQKPDLLILDLGLPDGNGIDLIRDLRGWSEVPVLILSARSQENDKIDALDAGADDYLTKPFSVGELRARVRALLRRRLRSGEDVTPVVEFGNVSVDLSRRQVLWGHVLRNAMVPVVTVMGLQFAGLVTGTVVIENVFSLPGLGRLVFQAISNRDLPLVQAMVMLLAATVIVINFVVDVLYAVIDPRLKMAQR